MAILKSHINAPFNFSDEQQDASEFFTVLLTQINSHLMHRNITDEFHSILKDFVSIVKKNKSLLKM